ncbi:ATP-binding cassette domain-containing protein [Granulicatella sp. zg-ZJ]|uniref:ABC transporter ATP-binding protein n=1 Tax=Granulicatella sp. zg-ZJ TaxID=2678504 RepID=UPI0013F72966|nr:ABC transporter ATP-binding protein [Granulicatella sp. zg-ZJ]NEW62777.1 ATP-binding cassette domain-containing protein [Granulicatella sp. zg-ZJ]
MIKLKNINKSANKSGINILKDIDLEINKGDFLAIWGKSGSGKSTLLNIIGLIDNCFSGEYLLDGINVKGMSDYERSKIRNSKMGYIFQSFFLVETMNVFENVSMPFLYSREKSFSNDRVMKCLDQVGLSDKFDSNIRTLSGGQKQKVAIARSLVLNPDIIIADEPTGSLDSGSSLEILTLLNDLNKKGVSIVIVTHDSDLLRYCNKVINIIDGKVSNES